MSSERLSQLQKRILKYIFQCERTARKYPEDRYIYFEHLRTSKTQIATALNPKIKPPTLREQGLGMRNIGIHVLKSLNKLTLQKASGKKPTLIITKEREKALQKEKEWHKFTNSVIRSVNCLERKKMIKPHYECPKWNRPYKLTETARRVASHLLNVGLVGGEGG
jgi:hypothetical protein